jgi:hypothetical protein
LAFDAQFSPVVAPAVGALSEFQVKPDLARESDGEPTSPLREVMVDILLRCCEGEDDSDSMSAIEYRTTWLSSSGAARKAAQLAHAEEEGDAEEEDSTEEEDEEEDEIEEEAVEEEEEE